MKLTMGEKIKDMRIERHMTTKQLAQATGSLHRQRAYPRRCLTAWRMTQDVTWVTAVS